LTQCQNISISNNAGDVNICRNSVSSDGYTYATSRGGAIYTEYEDDEVVISINNNKGSVNICDNSSKASSDWDSTASGGAIHIKQNLSINGNIGGVNICGNITYASSNRRASYSQGGAIFSSAGLTINNNGDICINNNSASATHTIDYGAYTYGGAIYTAGSLSINNNGEVSVIGNSTSCTPFSTYITTTPTNRFYGGAIYSSGSLSIVGNESATFEKNFEKNGGTYRLRSIYMSGDSSSDSLVLSAKSGGHITFYDSIYGTSASGINVKISLNADYEDAYGVTQKATGDIIFSGKYTEEHLKEVKDGVAGTSTEITNSRTSSLLNTVNLYGGTLRVEDKAVLNTRTLNVIDGRKATLRISDGEVNAGTYNVTVNGTGTLELTGTEESSKLTAKNVYIEKDGTLSVVDVVDPSEVITLAEAETVSIFNEKLGGIVAANVYMEAGATYRADGAHLSVQNGTLTFNATADEKINLVLTLMAAYEADSQVILFTDVNTVKFVLDNITATKTGQAITLNAADYFTGDWINENTSLVYDAGKVYLTGVNRVIPEPTTATLSLLALAALAARRRRK